MTDRRSTRTLAAVAVLTAGALLALSCGGDDADPAESADQQSGATSGSSPADGAEATASSFPVTIEHALGRTEIPNKPERVVTLGYGEGDIVAALGLTPLAVNAYGRTAGAAPPWFAEAVDGADVPALDLAAGIPYERIAGLDPDVILALTSDIDAEKYRLLSEIAPTVAYQTGPFKDSWQDAARTAGQALGEEDRARQLVEDVEGRIDAAASDNPQLSGRTVSVALLISPDRIGVLNSPAENTVRLLTELGMELPPAISSLPVGQSGYSAVLSREQVSLLEADTLMLYAISPPALENLMGDPLYTSLEVVRRGAVLRVQPDLWSALRTPSVLAIPYVLDRLVEPLASATPA